MAEVAGVVASGIAIGQLVENATSSIIRLRDFWKEVQEVPIEISLLLRQLDVLGRTLHNFRCGHVSKTSSDVAFQNNLELCEEASNELASLVDHMVAKMDGKHGWRKRTTAAKIVLRREEVKKLKKRMRYAIQLLSLAAQFQTMNLIETQPAVAVKQETGQMLDLMSKPSHLDIENSKTIIKAVINIHRWTSPFTIHPVLGALRYHWNSGVKEGKSYHDFKVVYYLPVWASDRVWYWRLYEKYSGWRTILHTYRVMPRDSALFDFAEHGNVEGIRALLERKEASVTDRENEYQGTALHIAAQCGQIEICKLLLFEGADPICQDIEGETPLQILNLFSSTLVSRQTNTNLHEITRLLLRAGANELLIGSLEGLRGYSGNLANFQYLKDEVYPPFESFSEHDRLSIIRVSKLNTSNDRNVALVAELEVWEAAFGSTGIDHRLASVSNKDGRTLLHKLTLQMLCSLSTSHSQEVTAGSEYNQSACLQICQRLISNCLSAGANIHATDADGLSCFSFLLSSGNWPAIERRSVLASLNLKLGIWLDLLLDCGVDLLGYGEEEMRLYEARKWALPGYPGPLAFAFGPEPENWRIWLDDINITVHKGASKSDEESFRLPGRWVED